MLRLLFAMQKHKSCQPHQQLGTLLGCSFCIYCGEILCCEHSVIKAQQSYQVKNST